MKSTKVFGIVLAVVVMVFVVAPVASAQTSWAILDDYWFKLKISMKGYDVSADGETIMGQGGGGGTAYLLMVSATNEYTITTCTEDDTSPGNWIKGYVQAPISTDNIYGATYPELWDFGGTALEFHNGNATYYVYPTLFIKVSTDGGNLKKAKISTVSCGLFVSDNGGEKGFGSCKISGSSIPMDKVASTVPPGCQ
jgi:hypothetical protein